MAPPIIGYGQATYVLTHAEIARPMAVTCGHEIGADGIDYGFVANRLFDAFALHILPSLDNQVTFQYVDLFVGADAAAGAGTVRSSNPSEPGKTAMNGLPANCSVLVTKVTSFLGRRGRGRMFLPFAVNEANVSEGGIIDGTWRDDIQDAFTAWREALLDDVAGPLTPVINSANGPSVEDRTARPVTGFQVGAQIATQRRRLRR